MQINKGTENGFLPVVIGKGSYNDLGVIRSLGDRGLRSVYLTDGEHIIPIKKSKYLIATIITNLDSDLVSSLIQIAKEYEKKLVLFPTSDNAASTIDENNEDLATFAILPNTQGRMEHFMDKGVQASLAHQAGFNVPNSASFDLESEIVPFENIHLPCIVKPRLSIKGSKTHITVCRTKDKLKSCINFYKDNSEFSILIQDFIEQEDGLGRVVAVQVVGHLDGRAHGVDALHEPREHERRADRHLADDGQQPDERPDVTTLRHRARTPA